MEGELILKISNLEKSYGNNILFKDVNINIRKGETIALLGQNGSGKTTFTKCLTGDEEYSGEVEIKSDNKIYIMEQDKNFEEYDITFHEYLKNKQTLVINQKKEIEDKFADPEIYENVDLYDKLMKKYELLNLKEEINIDEVRIKKILKNLNFDINDFDKKIKDLSGGQRTKLRLAEIFSKDVEILIFDEPTNYLDFKTIRFLELAIRKINKTMIVISHDRYFLSKLVSRVIEIEDNKFEIYNCNFKEYLEKRASHLEQLRHKHKHITKEKTRLKKSEEQKREWAHLVGSKKMKIQADKLEKKSLDLGDPANPDDFIDIYKLKFNDSSLLSAQLIAGIDICKTFPNKELFKDLNFTFGSKDKVAIIGNNGVGKTTLINILLGRDSYESGIVKSVDGLKIGYLSQEFDNEEKERTLQEYIWDTNSKLMEHDVISYLIKFGFSKEKLLDKIKTLSGGEKTRLSLLRLILIKPNILILDEPTNHLDIELIESLENGLKEFKGPILFISHDRQFIDKVANKIWILENKKIDIFEGNYSTNFE